MNAFDWIIIAIIGFFAVKSLLRGATREIFSLLALVLASILAGRYYAFPVPFLKQYIPSDNGLAILSFVIVFAGVYFCITLIGWLLSRFLKFIRLGLLDKTAGACVGVCKAYVVACCLVCVVVLLPSQRELVQKSRLACFGYPSIIFAADFFPGQLKGTIVKKITNLQHAADNPSR
ncbi:MAG: CvpA family protein [Deltaproteobacteria bacterium]|nr:CvpA family protein [Deltaproteobacteria bacterium]